MIYYFHDPTMPLYLLLVYAKASRENWSAQERAQARGIVRDIVDEYLKRGRVR